MVKIGLEIHLQPNSKSKLFCACSTEGAEPNTKVCPTCLGMPGSKPRLNTDAFIAAIKLALAMNCKIQKISFFARKTYFYPDLPKNFQITQYDQPFATEGLLELKDRKIPITRIHIEEDPASLKHVEGKKGTEYVLIDYNRSGTPLCEIVTPPVFSSPAEAREFLEELMRLADYIGIFDAQEGKIRADVNVSVEGHPRVEVKNITSFRDVERAAQFEIIRQESIVARGERGVTETRSFDQRTGTTDSMRHKETEEEYGYIPEPDLPPLIITDEQLEKVRLEMPEPPRKRIARFVKEYKIKQEQAESLMSERALADQFEEVVRKNDASLAAMWYSYVQKILNFNAVRFDRTGFKAEHMNDFLGMLSSGVVSKRGAELLLRELLLHPAPARQLAEKLGLLALGEKETEEIVEKVIKENPQAVSDVKRGKEKAMQFLVGQVIRASQGRAKEQAVLALLKNALKQ
ncbi:MAG: Asp-tRNA(Asn)/Glu-tRNA(Gln) amidotransferase subunit GatB [Candidatus Woesearchaeota archaeon]